MKHFIVCWVALVILVPSAVAQTTPAVPDCEAARAQITRLEARLKDWSTSEMGQAAEQLLIGLIEGRRKRKEEHVMVEPELVVRTSCGATRAAQV